MKRWLVLLAVVFVSSAFFTATFVNDETGALPAYEVNTDYYSDATFTTQVGFKILSCSGGSFTSGTVTPYRVVWQEKCYGPWTDPCLQCYQGVSMVACPEALTWAYGIPSCM